MKYFNSFTVGVKRIVFFFKRTKSIGELLFSLYPSDLNIIIPEPQKTAVDSKCREDETTSDRKDHALTIDNSLQSLQWNYPVYINLYGLL